MIISLIIFGLSLMAFIYVRSAITKEHQAQRRELKRRHAELCAQYESLSAEKAGLMVESANLTKQISKLKNSHASDSFSPPVSSRKSPKKNSEGNNVASYLLTNGLISLEQHQKALTTMQTLKLDLLSTCLTLGFIDEQTALEINDRFKTTSGT